MPRLAVRQLEDQLRLFEAVGVLIGSQALWWCGVDFTFRVSNSKIAAS
jgi:hypothetical protein